MKRPRYLVVQCCHIPHFFFAVRQLRARFPDAVIEGLVVKDDQVRYYVGLFGVLDRVYYAPDSLQDEYDGVVFPLWNRGYRTIKLQGWSVRGPKLDLGFEGNLVGLSAWTLRKSYLRPLHPFTSEFQDYLATFPHRPIGESVLFCQSCDRSLVRKLKPEVDKYLAPGSDICLVRSRGLRAALRRIRGRAFDSAVVFFSAEKGFAHLKILPFLLRIRKILVVNENGDCFYFSARSLARFLWQRIRSGFRQPRPLPPRILIFQTGSPQATERMVRRIRVQARFKRAEILVVCDPESRERLRRLPEVKRLFSLPRRPSLRQRIVFWKRLRNLTPDLTVASLTGRSGQPFHKLLFWLLPSRRLVFTAAMQCYRLSLRTVFLPFPEHLSETAEELDPSEGTILFVDGTRSAAAPQAIAMLGNPRVVRPRPVVVLCQASRRDVFRRLPGILQVVTYTRWNPFSKLWAILRCLALNVDVITGIFAGRRLSRINQLFLFFLPARHRLVFNQHMACFYADRHGVGPLLRTIVERSVARAADGLDASEGTILFVDGTRSAAATEAIAMLGNPRIVRPRPVVVLCQASRRDVFRRLPGILQVVTYKRWNPLSKFWAVLRCLALNVDVITGIFAGRRLSRINQLLLFLLPARHRLVFNQHMACFYADSHGAGPLLRTIVERSVVLRTASRGHTLFVDTTRSSRAVEAIGLLSDPKVIRKQPIDILCREDRRSVFEGMPGVRAIRVFRPWHPLLNLKTLAACASLDVDVIAGVFSGNRPRRWLQFLLFLLPARHRLVINRYGGCFYADLDHLPLLVRNLVDATPPVETVRPILFIDRPGSHRGPKAARRLQSPTISREQRPVTVVCPRGREALYRGIPDIARIYPYGKGGFALALLRVRRVVGLRPEIVATVFEGRRLGRLAQLLALTFPARHRLIFNQNLDCFYFSLGHFGRFWRALRERDELRARTHSYSLFVQTAEDEKAVRALRMLNDPSVARPRPIIVFCRRDKRSLFHEIEGVSRVITYKPGDFYANVKTIARFLTLDIEVIAAVFTGRPIYRPQKLLFFALPARNRLAFNSHLDCFYVTSRNWSALLARDKRQTARRISPALRVFLKASLFFPRFLFLVIWVTGLKMKRAYTQASEVK